jgi:hypothetical protein
MEWRCQKCGFDNHPALNLCEICNASHDPPPVVLVTQPVPITVYIKCLSCYYYNCINALECANCKQSLLRDSSSSNQGSHGQNRQAARLATQPTQPITIDTIKCLSCSYDNVVNALECDMCYQSLFRDSSSSSQGPHGQNRQSPRLATQPTQPINVGSKCLSCSYDNVVNALECANCEQLLFRDSSSSSEGPHGQNTQATEGLIELVSKCLQKMQKEEKVIKSGPNQGTFLKSEHALCCPFDFMSQRNAEGSEWSCGFRNIQNICGALIKESDEYKNKLFNKDGEIPDVYGIQSWIEKAWRAGYEVYLYIYIYT